MATPESQLWIDLRNGMRGLWHASRHEDRLGQGVPDVSYGLKGVGGWIELKVGSLRRDGVVSVSFRPAQIPWLLERSRSGAPCFVLMRLYRSSKPPSRCHLLLTPEVAQMANGAQIGFLEERALGTWGQGVDWSALAKLIS